MIGQKAKFNYPKEFVTLPDYTEHRGQIVTVLRQLTLDECDACEQPMYKIEAEDGWIGDAFGEELEPVSK